jgi:hypothetical protein
LSFIFPHFPQVFDASDGKGKWCYNHKACGESLACNAQVVDEYGAHQCKEIAWTAPATSTTSSTLNAEGCPSDYPFRTRNTVHKSDNYKYCYNREVLAIGTEQAARSNWTADYPAPSDYRPKLCKPDSTNCSLPSNSSNSNKWCYLVGDYNKHTGHPKNANGRTGIAVSSDGITAWMYCNASFV